MPFVYLTVEIDMTTPSLGDLTRTHPLPKGWSQPTVVEDTVVADGLELHRAGVASTGSNGEEMVGSAAHLVSSPLDRAYFELIERISTVEAIRLPPPGFGLRTLDGPRAEDRPPADLFRESDAPARWRYSRSNGVAVHGDWKSASLRAFWELCERDRVLRAWYGAVAPRRLPLPIDTPLGRAASYEWIACSFPETEGSPFSRGVHVCAVFGFPRVEAPLLFGYGARPSLDDAQGAATCEAMQSLAFLWGEELAKADPPFAPTALYHLETLQRPGRHGIVRRWLEGAHTRYRPPGRPADIDAAVSFVDLTPSWLRGLKVSKAVCAAAIPLTFGDAPFAAHLPPELRVHPIA